MQEKLVEAHQLLRALALGEFDGIEEHGNKLDSLAEFQRWFVLPTAEYAQHSGEFRKAAQAVAAAGKKKDLDAATDGYVSMVRKCVQCHEYMRGVREPGPRR
jgi:cytochrome c553